MDIEKPGTSCRLPPSRPHFSASSGRNSEILSHGDSLGQPGVVYQRAFVRDTQNGEAGDGRVETSNFHGKMLDPELKWIVSTRFMLRALQPFSANLVANVGAA